MCTRPLSILREDPIKGKYFDVVPCGRCPECINRKQAEFAALAVLEAKRASSVHFLTFTYRNSVCPIMVTDELGSSPAFALGEDHLQALYNVSLHDGRLYCATDAVTTWTPSVCRSDIKHSLASARLAFERKFGAKPDFRYAGFGEYG